MTRQRAVLGLIIAGCWAAVIIFAVHHAWSIYDDAYIYLRFVQNNLGDCPLAFNCADGPVEGFTSPLFLTLLTATGWMVDDLESLLQLICVVLLGAALTVTVLLAASDRLPTPTRAGKWAVVAGVALALAADDYVLLNAVVGLETGLTMLVVTALLASALRPELPWLRTLLVVAVLTRPECALFSLTVLLLPRARSLRWLAPLVAAAIVIVGLRGLIFGDVLPNTFWAKTGGSSTHALLGLEYLGETLLDFPLVLLSPLALIPPETRRPVAWFLSAAALWGLFYLHSGGDFFDYSRMSVPLVPALTLLALYGLVHAGKRVSERFAPAAPAAAAVTFAMVALAVHHIPAQSGFPNVERWSAIGRFLRQHHPGWSVAATPVGALSYFSHAHVIDLVGVTDRHVAHHGETRPEVLRREAIGHERFATDYVLSQRPDLIMTLSWQRRPWQRGDTMSTEVPAEWELVRAIRERRLPYVPYTPRVAAEIYPFFLMRADRAVELREQ